MNPPALLKKRLVIVAGKGGVGKSTVAAAFALSASRQGKRVLVAEVHGAERMSHFFEVAPIGPNIREIRPNLFAVNVQPRDAMREYALMVLRLKALYNLVFENRLVRYFLDAFPGLNELVMLGKIWYHVEEIDKKTGRPRWDLVVVDAPATGHGVFFLEFPKVVLAAIQGGPLAFHVAMMQEMLTDPRRTSLQIVTLPEEMPVREALDLRRVVHDELKIPLGYVFVNCVNPPLFNQRELEDYRLLLELTDARLPRLKRLFEAAQWRISRWRIEEEHLALIRRSLNLPRVELPFVYEREFRARAIEFLAQKMADQMGLAG
jgi:anion-transporting  ArsA/GET3 family ATPase